MGSIMQSREFDRAKIAAIRNPMHPNDPDSVQCFDNDFLLRAAVENRGFALKRHGKKDTNFRYTSIWEIRPIVMLDLPLIMRTESVGDLQNMKELSIGTLKEQIQKYITTYPVDFPENGILIVLNGNTPEQQNTRWTDEMRAIGFGSNVIDEYVPSLTLDVFHDMYIQVYGLTKFHGNIPNKPSLKGRKI